MKKERINTKKDKSFAPRIKVSDQYGTYDIAPRGWQWILGFALAGCEWAIREADTKEFREIIRKDLEKTYKENLEAKIKEVELNLTQLKDEYLNI